MSDEMIAGALHRPQEEQGEVHLHGRGEGALLPAGGIRAILVAAVVELVHTMWADGVVTIFHLDTDWARYLPYFKRDLPRASYMLQLDSTTDIFAAKELLRDTRCSTAMCPRRCRLSARSRRWSVLQALIDEVGLRGRLHPRNGLRQRSRLHVRQPEDAGGYRQDVRVVEEPG